jgi:hypothetical protein
MHTCCESQATCRRLGGGPLHARLRSWCKSTVQWWCKVLSLTNTLLAVNVGMFVADVALSSQATRHKMLNAMSHLQYKASPDSRLHHWGVKDNTLIRDYKQWYRLATCTILHGHLPHLLVCPLADHKVCKLPVFVIKRSQTCCVVVMLSTLQSHASMLTCTAISAVQHGSAAVPGTCC